MLRAVDDEQRRASGWPGSERATSGAAPRAADLGPRRARPAAAAMRRARRRSRPDQPTMITRRAGAGGRRRAARGRREPAPSRRLDGDLRRSRRRSRACSASSARWSPAYYFGAAGRINAFTVAFQIPNLVRALVADAALSSAFVPVFSDLLEKGERRRAWRVASSLFWLMLLGLTALTALFILVAPWVIGIFGDPGNDRAPRGRPLARALPDRRAARRLGDRRRDPQQLRPLHRAGALAGLLEHRDHRRARDRRAAGAQRRARSSTSTRSSILVATFIQVLPADAVAARARPRRGAAARRPRLARPGRQAGRSS